MDAADKPPWTDSRRVATAYRRRLPARTATCFAMQRQSNSWIPAFAGMTSKGKGKAQE
ncbi:hypothetical protein GCM10027159_11300 [Lysobacter terrae]